VERGTRYINLYYPRIPPLQKKHKLQNGCLSVCFALFADSSNRGAGLQAANTIIHEGQQLARRAFGTQTSNKKRKVNAGYASTQTTGGGSYNQAGYVGRLRGKRAKIVRRRRMPVKKRVSRKRGTYKRKSRVVKGENYYGRVGAIATLEVTGALSDSDCVYIGHSSFAVTEMMRMLSAAIMRKLFKMALRWEPDNIKTTIPYRLAAGAQISNGYMLVVKKINTDDNVKTQDEYTPTAATHGIEDPAEWFLLNHLNAISAEASSSTAVERNNRLLWLHLVDVGTESVRAQLDLTTLMCEVYSKSNLKIQNVTVPSATATEADNVNNVPLIGRSYHMSNWQPMTADDDMGPLNRVNQDTGVLGVEIKQSGTLGSQYVTWKEPPPSKAFINCVSSVPQRMEPGTIKNHVSIMRTKMSLPRILEAIHIRRGNVLNKTVKIGKHDLFAFERMISVPGELPLKIIYECNVFTGAAVYTRKKGIMMQAVKSVAQSASTIPG